MPAPRKRFGQHFLCDRAVINRIIDALDPTYADHLVEIGPGQGALTMEVLKRVKQLEAIELDRDLIPLLEERTRKLGNLTIYPADALTFDFSQLKKNNTPLRLFGNLPYNISTPLLFHLLSFGSLIADMLFMLQKEVALRLTAPPSDEHYGRLSVMVQYHAQATRLFDITPNAFFPPPQVQSSMVELVPYPTLPIRAKNEVLFADVVRLAFGMRRKTLRNSLKQLVKDEIWEAISVHSDARPETLSVKDFVEIADACVDADVKLKD